MKFPIVTCLIATALAPTSVATPFDWLGSRSDDSKPQCGPRVVSLATGIHLNIGGQHAELNATRHLEKVESRVPVNMTSFLLGKGELLADIATGMSLRIYNQAVAPKDNPALPGLAKYAMAQKAEQKLVESLNGIPSHDKSILDTLVKDIKSGTMLNVDNLRNATEHCDLGFKFPA